MSREKVVLAYSGGLDTSVILKWLDLRGYDVIAYVANVGQRENFQAIEEKAYKTGAKDFYILDLTEEFTKDYVFTSIKYNALYEGRYMLGTSIARPLIAKGMVKIARDTGAKYVAHGATGKGNDQVRFELSIAALAPDIKTIAPWRMPDFYNTIKGRTEAIDYAKMHNIPIKATKDSPWSSDENLMHVSFEAGILEDPLERPPENMYEFSIDPKKAPDEPESLQITFEKGDAVKINGKNLSPANILEQLNLIGGRHGVGRIDIVENRYVGMKSRGIYETPGGTILMVAHRDLEGLTLEGGLINLKDTLMPRFATLAYNGYWFTSEMECLKVFVNESQKFVTGEVFLEIYKGVVTITGRKSPFSLYDPFIATMDDDLGYYDQTDATGFIKLNSIPLINDARRRSKQEKETPQKGE